MSDNKNRFEPLESIIKIEPEQFQEEILFRPTKADEWKKEAKLCPEPIVLLERLQFEATPEIVDTKQVRKKTTEINGSHPAFALARKDNEGLKWKDPQTCCICKKVFSNRANLKHHLKNFHNKAPAMFCDLCPKVYFSKSVLRGHMKVHSTKVFACNVCDYRTAYKRILKIHKLTHDLSQCLICNKQVALLQRHMKSHEPKVTCPICNKSISQLNMKRHIKTHDKGRYKCKDCGGAFENREFLRNHILRQHFDGKLHECHCGSVFASKGVFKIHQLAHNEVKFPCKDCNRKYSNFHNLKFHWKKEHSKTYGQISPHQDKPVVFHYDGPFTCDKCGSTQSNRKTFSHHMNWKHLKAPLLFCDLCPRSFHQKFQLSEHMERVHLKLRPFACDLCEFTASKKCNLDIHKMIHGKKTKCRVCHKFVSNVKNHMKSHETASCPICKKKLTKKSLKNHINLHKRTKNPMQKL